MKIAWFIFVYVIEFLQMTQLNVYPTIRKCILVFVFLFLGLFLFLSFVLKDKSAKEDTKICTHPTHPYHTQIHTHIILNLGKSYFISLQMLFFSLPSSLKIA